MIIKIQKIQIKFELAAYILLGVVATYFVGTRGEAVGSDTATYFQFFDYVNFGSDLEASFSRIEIGFYWLTKIIGYFTDSKELYLSIIFAIQFVGITSALSKKSEIFKPYLFMALIWLSFPFFYSISLNVIRQGLAFVFVIYAIDLKLQNKKYTPYMLLLLGGLFHYATFLYFIGFIVVDLRLRYKQLLFIWFVMASVSFFGLIDKIILFLLERAVGLDPYFSTYLNSSIDESYVKGFRFDFFIFSALPIFYNYVLMRYGNENNEELSLIFKLYLSMNILYWCFTGFPFNDRFAIASWLLMPLMIDFNFLKMLKLNYLFTFLIPISSISIFYYYLF